MSSVRIHELLARRLTTHAFDPEERVSRADCSALLRAAHAAPSWNNQQPWRFLVCDRFERPDAWQSAFDALERKERPWAYNAALFIVVAVDLDDVPPETRARLLFDAGGAASQLCLEATSRNLATQVTTGFAVEPLRAAFEIPEQVACAALICVGRPADLGTLGRDVYRRETALRERAPIESRCFDARWGRPLDFGDGE